MASFIEVKLSGVDKARAITGFAIDELNKRLKVLTAKTAATLLVSAKSRAPVNTGRLASSLTGEGEFASSNPSATGSPAGQALGKGDRNQRRVSNFHVVVGTNTPYAEKIENGGATRSQNFFGEVPRSFFRPAVEDARRFLLDGKLPQAFQDAVKAARARADGKAPPGQSRIVVAERAGARAAAKIEKSFKAGELRSGGSGRIVTNPAQAAAISGSVRRRAVTRSLRRRRG